MAFNFKIFMVNKNTKQNNKNNLNIEESIDFSNKKRNFKKKINFKKIKIISLFLVLLFIIVVSIFSFISISNKKNSIITQDSILLDLKKYINLPETEPVNFMRVSDAKTLSSQDKFYKNVNNGDYIIVYENMAIIYNFKAKRIINIKTMD